MAEVKASLVHIDGETTKPVTVFFQKIDKAVSGLCKPYQIARVADAHAAATVTDAKARAEAAVIEAKAQAEVRLMEAKTDLKITDLHRRAMYRFIDEEAKKQENMEAIAAKAVPLLESHAKPAEMDDDWIVNFFDKCRIVSDGEMQGLWSRVLAGEANAAGSYSKRTVSFLGSMDRADAALFTRLCGFGWGIRDFVLFIYDPEQGIYSSAGINLPALNHLDDLGLVSFSPLSGYRIRGLPKFVGMDYFGERTIVEFQNEQANELAVGQVLLSQVGSELARICGTEPVSGFKEYILRRWADFGLCLCSPYPRVTMPAR